MYSTQIRTGRHLSQHKLKAGPDTGGPPFQWWRIFKNLTEDQLKTLLSIREINDYPVYVMTYYGDYGFDDYLKTGWQPSQDRLDYLKEACSCFSALNPEKNRLYGRNLDLTRLYPVLVIFTDPPQGYASISLYPAIDLELYLYNPTSEYIQWVLEYPIYPLDGMNEYGVTMAGMAVQGEEVYDPNKVTLQTYQIRRLVLDYARNVEEAIALLGQYNNRDSASVHYLISDAGGNSALVEYYDGQVNVQRNVEPWQVSTNFLLKGAPPDSVLGTCPRYDWLYIALSAVNGLFDKQTAMNALSAVSQYNVPLGNGRFAYTVWSAVYDMTDGWLNLCPGTQYGNMVQFKLDMVSTTSIEQTQGH